jgi:hypothetical protein
MKRATRSKPGLKIALALTWDGSRWPRRSLPPKARAFLEAKGFTTFSRREMTKLLPENRVGELRICWVPRLKGGADILADAFPAPNGRRIPFRAVKTLRFGDLLGVIYRPGR